MGLNKGWNNIPKKILAARLKSIPTTGLTREMVIAIWWHVAVTVLLERARLRIEWHAGSQTAAETDVAHIRRDTGWFRTQKRSDEGQRNGRACAAWTAVGYKGRCRSGWRWGCDGAAGYDACKVGNACRQDDKRKQVNTTETEWNKNGADFRVIFLP